MITIFNRKEVYITFRPEDYARIKDILLCNGIEHYTKFGGNNAISGGRRRSYPIGGSFACQFTIYVHKNDYEKAVHLIHK